MTRAIRLLIIHCTATPDDRTLFAGRAGTPGFRDPAMEIDGWHRARNFRRDTYWRGRQNPDLQAIGYHYLVARNGALFTGRHDEEPGAHAQGWNSPSLGLCLVGERRYTAAQWVQLAETVAALAKRYDIPLVSPWLETTDDGRRRIHKPGVCGHRELPGVAKNCPGFPVADWLSGGLQPLPEHLA